MAQYPTAAGMYWLFSVPHCVRPAAPKTGRADRTSKNEDTYLNIGLPHWNRSDHRVIRTVAEFADDPMARSPDHPMKSVVPQRLHWIELSRARRRIKTGYPAHDHGETQRSQNQP